MCTADYLFGDSQEVLIPVSCLAEHLFLLAVAQIAKIESITPSSSSSRYLSENLAQVRGRLPQVTDGDGDGYLSEICVEYKIWNMDFDIT